MSAVGAWMPLWVGDYLADTSDLSAEEHGAYLLLLMAAWRAGGELPDAGDGLRRIARVERDGWAAVWSRISRFFRVRDGVVTQGRLTEEFARATRLKVAAVARAQKGGRAKAASSTRQALVKQPPSSASGVLQVCSSPSPPDPDRNPQKDSSLVKSAFDPGEVQPVEIRPEVAKGSPKPDRGASKPYPMAFSALWAGILAVKHPKSCPGAKGEALAAWFAAGKPAAATPEAWARYLRSLPAGQETSKHVCRWIKFGMFEAEDAPVAPKPAPRREEKPFVVDGWMKTAMERAAREGGGQ